MSRPTVEEAKQRHNGVLCAPSPWYDDIEALLVEVDRLQGQVERLRAELLRDGESFCKMSAEKEQLTTAVRDFVGESWWKGAARLVTQEQIAAARALLAEMEQ